MSTTLASLISHVSTCNKRSLVLFRFILPDKTKSIYQRKTHINLCISARLN